MRGTEGTERAPSSGERRSSARAEAAPAYRARREEIIAAAGKAFLAKGYRATSFRDIADAVGVDRASLYYYFESKHELFRAATSVAVQRNVDDAESIAASDQPPAAKMVEIVQRLLASYTDRDYPYMFIFLQEDVNGISEDSDDEWAQAMNDYNRRYERAITAVIEEGAERGDFVLPGAPARAHQDRHRHGQLVAALVPRRRGADRGGDRRRVRVDIPVRRGAP